MHPNARLITTFYEGFQRRDAAAMVACYHPDVVFNDPVFRDLRGRQAGDMWRMLGGRAQELEVSFRDVVADDTRGRAHWDASYLFSETGRRVHNSIDATFELRDGLIARHDDHFDLWKWTRMALGARGALLGWLPPVQGAIRKKAAANLAAFVASQPAAAAR
jgi:uncharacterized protein